MSVLKLLLCNVLRDKNSTVYRAFPGVGSISGEQRAAKWRSVLRKAASRFCPEVLKQLLEGGGYELRTAAVEACRDDEQCLAAIQHACG